MVSALSVIKNNNYNKTIWVKLKGSAVLRTLFYVTALHSSWDCNCIVLTLLSLDVVAKQWWGDTALTLLLFWRQSTASFVFRVSACGWAFALLPPSSLIRLILLPVKCNTNSNRPPHLCGRKAKCLNLKQVYLRSVGGFPCWLRMAAGT